MANRPLLEVLTDYRVYDTNNNELLGVADVTLPSFDSITTTIKGAGIGGEIEVPIVGHFKSMTVTLKWRVTERAVIQLMSPLTHFLTFRAAIQSHGAIIGVPMQNRFRVSCEGRTKKTDIGKLAAGETMDPTTEIEVSRLNIFSDDVPVLLFDKLRSVLMIEGIDYLADLRAAMGINLI